MRLFIHAIASLLLLAGCAVALGPQFQQLEPTSADKATVYVYRPSLDFFRPGHPEVFVNGSRKFALRDGGYSVFTLSPGTYEIKFEGQFLATNWAPPAVTHKLGVEAGREYFIRAYPEKVPGGPLASRTVVSLVQKEQAVQDLKRLSLLTD